MLSAEEYSRYNRQLILPGFGEEAQRKLKAASVLIIGAGGLGCPVLQYLVAAGVGRVGIVDGDDVALSNLHRQILYNETDVGRNKAFTAANKLQKQNKHTEFDVYEEFLSNDNALEVIANYDLVVDGSDNFETRYLVNDACVILDKPFVYGAVLKFEGQVSVFNLGDGPTYRCIFPDPPAPDSVPNCAEIGVIGVLPGLVGSYQGLEAIKVLAGIGETLSGKLLLLDGLKGTHYSMKVKTVAANKQIRELSDYSAFCGSVAGPNGVISALDLKKQLNNEDIFLLDVREPKEYGTFNIGGCNIPLDAVSKNLSKLPTDKRIVLVCQSGRRSDVAKKMLEKEGFTNVLNLEKGLSEW